MKARPPLRAHCRGFVAGEFCGEVSWQTVVNENPHPRLPTLSQALWQPQLDPG